MAADDEPSTFEVRPGPRLVVGAGSLRRLGGLARELGAVRALVVSDPGIVAAGHTAAALGWLAEAGVTAAVFSAFGENPTTDHIAAGAEAARAFRPDLLVGLGGGSSMDCAKGINFLFSCGGRMQDYRGRDSTPAPMLPSIAVPTTAGTGSETQSFALVSDPATGMKMACGAAGAAFRIAILDVDLTLTQPLSLVALTGIDALSHAVESHVSRAATPASRLFSRDAFRLLATNLPEVFADGGTIAARSAVQFGAALAGLAIENSMLGAAHALANPLTAAHHVAHGQAVGLMLPHVVRFNGSACNAGYAELLGEIGTACEPGAAAECLATWLADLLARSRLATTLTAARVAAPDTAALATQAAAQWTAGFNPRPVTAADLARLYEAAR
ncbi:MAG: iron-containing alcohol dehydrogenase [Planctomycetia bacterium]